MLTFRSSRLLLEEALRSLPARAVTSFVAIVGFAGVAIVVTTLLAFRANMLELYSLGGRDDIAVITSDNARWEIRSTVSRDDALSIAHLPFLDDPSRHAKPLISEEVVTNSVELPARKGQLYGPYALARGVTEAAILLRPGFQIVSGRFFHTGLYEAVLGKDLQLQYPYLHVGSKLLLDNASVTIVGIFTVPGNSASTEIWLDKSTLQRLILSLNSQSAGSPGSCSSIWLKLPSPQALTLLKTALSSFATNHHISLQAMTERQFLQKQSQGLIARMTLAAGSIAAIMGAAALFGAVVTLYASVQARSREFATLRAIGFSDVSIGFSVLSESLLLSLIGGSIGIAMATLLFRSIVVPVFNSGSNSVITLHFQSPPIILAQTIGYCAFLGCLGSFLPSIRALRGSVTAALALR